MRDSKYYSVASAAAPRALVSSTDATPIVVTLTGHPYSTGDFVAIVGHTTNTNANGHWIVTKVSANTFSLDGSTAQGAGAGGADGVISATGKVYDVGDYKTVVISYMSDGGGDAAFTLSLRGAISEDIPDFAIAASASNPWSAIEGIDLEGNDPIEGDTGIAIAGGADDYRIIEVNVNALKWFCPIIIAGTAGEITVAMRAFYE